MLRRVLGLASLYLIASPSFAQVDLSNVINGISGSAYESLSPTGPQINNALASLSADPKKNLQILSYIKGAAEQGKPEALNGMGWLLDNGYFGIPKNPALAQSYFVRASDVGFVVAQYNLASMAFWGRSEKPSMRDAYAIVSQLQSTKDSAAGGHICGLASFISWRMGKRKDSVEFANGCNGPLATVAKTYFEKDYPTKVKTAVLSLAITNDVYPLMIEASKNDPIELCAWSALALSKRNVQIDRYGSKCLTDTTAMAIAVGRKNQIRQLRDANNILFSASVPFLPYPIDTQKKMEGFNKK